MDAYVYRFVLFKSILPFPGVGTCGKTFIERIPPMLLPRIKKIHLVAFLFLFESFVLNIFRRNL
jgi:hypothetical protein